VPGQITLGGHAAGGRHPVKQRLCQRRTPRQSANPPRAEVRSFSFVPRRSNADASALPWRRSSTITRSAGAERGL
jgi:hypothetical protein